MSLTRSPLVAANFARLRTLRLGNRYPLAFVWLLYLCPVPFVRWRVDPSIDNLLFPIMSRILNSNYSSDTVHELFEYIEPWNMRDSRRS